MGTCGPQEAPDACAWTAEEFTTDMKTHRAGIKFRLGTVMLAAMACAAGSAAIAQPRTVSERIKAMPLKIAWECYVNGNWEIFAMNADGSHAVNLTNTPGKHEHYPQVSPDGRRIAYTVNSGQGRDTVRSLWVMDVNGKHPRKIADHAREPFWSPDGKILGFLPQEYPKFDVIDYYTKGMVFYNLATGKSEMHPNSAKLHHLYNPGFSRNGKWIVAM